MSDSEQGSKSSVNWGGWVKTILAGAAVVAAVEMIFPGSVTGLFKGEAGAKPFFSKEMMEGIGGVIRTIGGLVVGGIGLSYLFSDKSNDNADRHAQHYSEAKESFAIREDMRKMQTVMMARMKAAGHEPAMQMGGAAVG